jgi:hypothetical protein
MPLGQGILEVLEAIPRRIEMSGQAPTWRVTGASYDAVVSFAAEVLPPDAVVVAREDRNRWWPRVTLTLSVDPALVDSAPPAEELRKPPAPPVPAQRASTGGAAEVPLWNDEEYAESFSPLEEIFAHQEEVRVARRDVPEQRSRPRSHRAE